MRLTGNLARKQTGAAFIVLVTVSSVLIVGALGLFSVELVRGNMARQELTAVCNAAALAGATAMASYNPEDGTFDEGYAAEAKAAAVTAARQSFTQNSILGVPLSSASVSTNEDLQLDSSQVAEAKVEFVAQGAGTAVKVAGAVNLTPMTGAFLPIGMSTLTALSSATIPKIDIILAMGITGSLDDDTRCQLMVVQDDPGTEETTTGTTSHTGNTYQLAMEGMPEDWTPAPQEKSGTIYTSYTTTTTTPPVRTVSEVSVEDRLYSLVEHANANQPQMLCNSNDNKYTFNSQLRANPESVEPSSSDYTHLIVVDGNAKNLWVSSPDSTAYWNEVPKYLKPWVDVKAACTNFFTIFQTNADAHFGLVTFESQAATRTNSTMSYNPISEAYTSDVAYELPLIALDKDNNNYDTIKAAMDTIKPLGEGTNLQWALRDAIDQCKVNARKIGSKKAIVLFTDKVADTVGLSASTVQSVPAITYDDVLVSIKAEALRAHANRIPIYTVGLSHRNDKDVMKGQLSEISTTAGHGGMSYVVTNASDLNKVFENIARSLVSQAQLAEAK